jgi:Ca-activated chloride channel homolog
MKWILIVILSFIAFNGFTQAERKFIRRGNREYEDKKYQEAEIQYRKAFEKNSGSVAADFNLGNALYKQKQYEAAASRYAGLAEKQKKSEELNRQYYNLGNALYKEGKFKECIDAYKNALRKYPGDMDAKHNLQLAMKKLQAENQKKNQEKQQQKDNKDNKQNNKQDNKQNNQQQQNQEKNNKQQDQEKNGQQEGKNNRQPEKQNASGKISPQDAERILQALENEEKNVLRKVQEQQKHGKKVPVDKNW